MPNVCIIPTGDRSGQANMIHHYCKVGCKVYLPKHGTGNLNWSRIATWPALLCRSTKQPNKRNLEIHGFQRKDGSFERYKILNRIKFLKGDLFGEDRFIKQENNGPLYQNKKISCEIVDFENEKIDVDLFHTLRGSDEQFKQSWKFKEKYFPKAKWITSTIYSDHHLAGGRDFENVCKMMPANYDNLYLDKNYFNCWPSGFEFELLNMAHVNIERKGYASFNHNFKERYPEDYELLKNLNKKLKKHNIFIPNYGGNISGHGADIKFNQKGPTGNLTTLSIRDAAALNKKLKAVIVFKQADYGGGTIWYALMSGLPIITHRDYIKATHADSILKDGENSLIIDDLQSAYEAIVRLENDQMYYQKLQKGMEKTFMNLINDEYWQKFRKFVEKAI